jgi:hypothetical protein
MSAWSILVGWLAAVLATVCLLAAWLLLIGLVADGLERLPRVRRARVGRSRPATTADREVQE